MEFNLGLVWKERIHFLYCMYLLWQIPSHYTSVLSHPSHAVSAVMTRNAYCSMTSLKNEWPLFWVTVVIKLWVQLNLKMRIYYFKDAMGRDNVKCKRALFSGIFLFLFCKSNKSRKFWKVGELEICIKEQERENTSS